MVCSNSAVEKDFVKDDCAVGSAVLDKRGYNLSSTQTTVLFQVKPTEKKFSELTESAAMGFSMVCVMLQAVYLQQKRVSDYCIFIF